jgi:hypothetical protein
MVSVLGCCRRPIPFIAEVIVKIHVLAASGFAFAVLLLPVRAADEPKADKEQPIHEISLEVQALRALYSLKLTNEQMKMASKLAKETNEPARKRTTPKVSDEYRKIVTNLRDALIAADDDDKIGDLEEELDRVTEKEKPQLDDSFDITKAARKRTPEIIKSFKAAQLAAYYGFLADEVEEPLDQLTKALAEVRGLEKKEWTDKRDEIAGDMAWAVAGLDAAKSEKVSDKVVALLSKARALSNADFKAKKANLAKEAKTIVGEVEPDTLLRHYAERTVADMLSNPRLEAAIKARLK